MVGARKKVNLVNRPRHVRIVAMVLITMVSWPALSKSPEPSNTNIAKSISSPPGAPAGPLLSSKGLYLKARDLFAAGQYKAAIQYAAASRRRLPNAQRPVVLMAQSYYRLGMVSRASALFQSIDLAELPQEASVDYVLTMFSAKRYRSVIKGSALVPDAHPYKGVVRFYTGVSYMHLKLYSRAQKSLYSATDLPPDLKAQRKRLLAEIEDLRDRERLGQGDLAQQYAYQNQSLYLPPPPPPAPPVDLLPGGTPGGSAAPKKVPPTPPPPAKASTSYSAKPSFEWSQKSTKRDFSGFNQSQTDEQSPSAALALAVKFLGSPRPFGGQPSLDLNVTPSYSNSESKTTQSKLTAPADAPSSVQNLVTKTSSSGYAFTKSYGADALYQVTEPIDIGLGLKRSDAHSVTSGKPKSDITTTTPSAKLMADIGDFKTVGSWTQDQIDDSVDSARSRSNSEKKLALTRGGENATVSASVSIKDNSKPLIDGGIKSTFSLNASWLRNFEDFSLNLSGSKTDLTRVPVMAPKTVLNKNSVSATVSYSMLFGLSVDVLAGYSQLSNLVVQLPAVAEVVPEAMASGSAKQLSVSLKVSPVSFLSLNTSYDYTSRALTIGNAEFEKKMQTDNWSQQTITTLKISANMNF
jgi:tetratricopeptide (TPR) repeat protein